MNTEELLTIQNSALKQAIRQLELELADYKKEWRDAKSDPPPFQVDIIFESISGGRYAGCRFLPTQRSNTPIYQDFKKQRIRKNIVKWKLI